VDGVLIDRIEEISLVGIISREELHELLNKAGFMVAREYGDYSFASFREGDSLLIVEAEAGNPIVKDSV